jgi:hypothetical protein
MTALTIHTNEIFDKIVSLECIKPYILVGGTALALQLHARLSEDLDFQSWKSHIAQKQEVDWVNIEKQLATIGIIQSREIWDFDHVEFVVSGVKISFYACPKMSPFPDSILVKDNLRMANIKSIAAMKMEVMLRRNNFRDYYDIYSIFKQGVNFKEIVDLALLYSGHLLSTKNLLAMLTDSSRFNIDSNFKLLQPTYKVTPKDIESFLKDCIKNTF